MNLALGSQPNTSSLSLLFSILYLCLVDFYLKAPHCSCCVDNIILQHCFRIIVSSNVGLPFSFCGDQLFFLYFQLILTLSLFLSSKERKMSCLISEDSEEDPKYHPHLFLQGLVWVCPPFLYIFDLKCLFHCVYCATDNKEVVWEWRYSMCV